jgi:membrane-associated phospholipid phosphatase
MRKLVRAFDEKVDGWFDRWRGQPQADRLFYFASDVADFGLLWVLLAAARGVRGGPVNERAALRGIVGTGVESVLVNLVLKTLIGRVRPRNHEPRPHRLRQPLTSSFPSGHATAAFCAAVLLSEEDPIAPVYFAAAAVVAASRVHVKIHHPSDVAAGVVIGLALGVLGRRIVPLRGPLPAVGKFTGR